MNPRIKEVHSTEDYTIEDYEDLSCRKEAKTAEKDSPTISIEELKKRMKGKTIRSTHPTKSGD